MLHRIKLYITIVSPCSHILLGLAYGHHAMPFMMCKLIIKTMNGDIDLFILYMHMQTSYAGAWDQQQEEVDAGLRYDHHRCSDHIGLAVDRT